MVSATLFLVLARWRWVKTMLKAAENKEPIAYVIATVCVVVSIFGVLLLARNFYRMVQADPNKPYKDFKSSIGAVLSLALFIYIGFEMIRRLIS